ncbi:MAG: hypothetical protein ACJAUP_002858 [Cellvibrionaceae bacterium]|jgi:hypothetical protein
MIALLLHFSIFWQHCRKQNIKYYPPEGIFATEPNDKQPAVLSLINRFLFKKWNPLVAEIPAVLVEKCTPP